MSNYLVLSRSDLYDMVWSTPTSKLAQDFGISDVALAKRCKAVDVPVPPRGYWAKVTAGQTPRRTPLPKYRGSGSSTEPLEAPATPSANAGSAPPARGRRETLKPGREPEVHFGLPTAPPPPRTSQATLSSLPRPALPLTTDLTTALPVIRRLAKHLKLPGRAEIPLNASERTGPLPQVKVSPNTLERALKFLDSLFRATNSLGCELVEEEPEPQPDPYDYRYRYGREPPPPKPLHAELLINGERIGFHIEERYRTETREPTAAEKRRMERDHYYRPDLQRAVPTGGLRFIRHDTSYPAHIRGRTWYDQGSRGVETKLPQILAELKEAAAQAREKRLRHEEEERQRRDRERLAAELVQRREAHQKLIHELEHQAGACHRAQYLRRYLRAARRATGTTTITATLQDESIDFLAWAEHYIDQLDPLHPEPRDPDLQAPAQPYYYGRDESRTQAALLRLAGASWESAKKLGATDRDVPDTEDDDDFDP